MRLQLAILQFLGNELQLDPETILPDTPFSELGLDPVHLSDLLHRLQDALAITLPEDKVPQIITVGDLLDAVEDQPE